jgi:catechol 2,3-dioxygenase-like lactoylglutathione lyase family enzyme
MITRVSHVPIYVVDQDRAKAFYTEKLGFEVRADERLGTFRWLTVGPKGQPDLEITLMGLAQAPALDESSRTALRHLVESGKLGACVFHTTDCRATYEELKARGVVFSSPPTERPYGVEAVFRDDSNNWFSLTQRR